MPTGAQTIRIYSRAGWVDTSPGGLRDVCLAGFRLRDDRAPGYAIGGLAEEESKDNFWRVVDHCCRAFCDVAFYGISCAARARHHIRLANHRCDRTFFPRSCGYRGG